MTKRNTALDTILKAERAEKSTSSKPTVTVITDSNGRTMTKHLRRMMGEYEIKEVTGIYHTTDLLAKIKKDKKPTSQNTVILIGTNDVRTRNADRANRNIQELSKLLDVEKNYHLTEKGGEWAANEIAKQMMTNTNKTITDKHRKESAPTKDKTKPGSHRQGAAPSTPPQPPPPSRSQTPQQAHQRASTSSSPEIDIMKTQIVVIPRSSENMSSEKGQNNHCDTNEIQRRDKDCTTQRRR